MRTRYFLDRERGAMQGVRSLEGIRTAAPWPRVEHHLPRPDPVLGAEEQAAFTQGVTALSAGESFLAAVVLPADGRTSTSMMEVVVLDAMAGDVDGDGFVNGNDLAILLAAWGTNDPVADIDGDGVVAGGDLGMLLAAWTG